MSTILHFLHPHRHCFRPSGAPKVGPLMMINDFPMQSPSPASPPEVGCRWRRQGPAARQLNRCAPVGRNLIRSINFPAPTSGGRKQSAKISRQLEAPRDIEAPRWGISIPLWALNRSLAHSDKFFTPYHRLDDRSSSSWPEVGARAVHAPLPATYLHRLEPLTPLSAPEVCASVRQAPIRGPRKASRGPCKY